ncbi:MAG: TonB-dependent receptor [Propionivibrio sp.]
MYRRTSGKNPKQRPTPYFRTPHLGLCVALSLAVGSANAAQGDHDDLTSINLEDLMKVEVSSVARKQQKMSDTAAAAYVISQEDIRRSGATSIPEALRLAPGLDVARIGSNGWAISSRGFNGRYANKLLVLMDGRTIYTPMFSGVFWDVQDTLMEDIERIEVIRGPGAAMWGANAVNGVINIITKSAKDTQGNLAVAGAGNQERGFAGLRHGGQVNEDTYYRVYGKAFDRGAAEDASGKRLDDDWRGLRSGFRLDKKLVDGDKLTVQGDAYTLKVGETVRPFTILTPPYSGAYAADDDAKGMNVLARWQHRLADQSEITLQAYFDRTEFYAPKLSETQNTVNLDFQHRLPPSLVHDIMWGVNVRYIQSHAGNTAEIAFDPESRSYTNAGFFVQDDIALIPERLRLTLGGKIENSYFGGTELQPNARLLWTPDGSNSVWASVSRASRTPSRGEIESRIALGVLQPTPASFNLPVQVMTEPNADLEAERFTAYEIGYRTLLTPRLSLDVTAFSNHYRNLIAWNTSATPALALTPVMHLTAPLPYINTDTSTRTHGLELVADWRPLDWMRLEGSYTYLHVNAPPDDGVNTDIAGSSPNHQYSLRWLLDLNARTQLDFWMRHVGRLRAEAQQIPAYTELDIRLGYAASKNLDLSLVGQNLLDARHAEFSDAATTPVSYIPRGIYAKATWKF